MSNDEKMLWLDRLVNGHGGAKGPIYVDRATFDAVLSMIPLVWRYTSTNYQEPNLIVWRRIVVQGRDNSQD